MNKLEQKILRAGGILISHKKHKVYSVNGETFILSHGGNKKTESRDRNKQMERKINKLLEK